MSVHFSRNRTQIISTETHHCAIQIFDGTWSVSWLEGTWDSYNALAAIDIADMVADNPPMNDRRWRAVENILTTLNIDPACLDTLIDPEPDTDDDEEGLS